MLKAFFIAILVPPVYLSLRLLCQRAWPLWTRLAGSAALLVVSQVYTIDSLVFRNLSGPDMPAWLLMTQLCLFTAMILFFLLLLANDALHCIRWAIRAAQRHAGQKTRVIAQSRRAFLCGGTASLGVTLAAPVMCLGTSAIGIAQGTALPQLHRMEARLPLLPAALDGFCLVHITDVHIGPLTSIDWVQQTVHLANSVHPDLICLTGDLTDGRWNYQVARGGTRIEAARAFADFQARHGVLACTGNHEYYSDYTGWMQLYAEVGIQMLHYAGVVLRHKGTPLSVVGLDDPMAPGPATSLSQVLSAVPGHREGAIRIVLDHRPTRAAALAAAGADMLLSGHTHGGQCFGMDRIVARANGGYVRGWYTVADMPLYVSNGVGLWSGFPVRLGIPAEIAVITLRQGTNSASDFRDL